MIGCYFSKPDWHCEWFWNPYFATPTRRINYKKERHPEWWEKYCTFTRNQLNELTSRYGSLDILWLDGGWIAGEDIGLDGILEQARQRHPGLISVDRTIRGRMRTTRHRNAAFRRRSLITLGKVAFPSATIGGGCQMHRISLHRR